MSTATHERTDEVLQKELLQAKNDGDTQRVGELIVEILLPLAREAIKASRHDVTHKDGYTVIMRTATQCGEYSHFFLKACELEGYPSDTLEHVRQLV